MEFNLEGTLKNAIESAALDHNDGMLVGDRFKYRFPTEDTSFLVANVRLPDGRNGQAQIRITNDPDDFIDTEDNTPTLDLREKEEQTHELD